MTTLPSPVVPASAGAIATDASDTADSFAIRAVDLTREPLNNLPKHAGEATRTRFKNVGRTLGGMLRGGPKRTDDDKGAQNLLDNVSFEIAKGSVTAIPGADQRAMEALGRMLTGSLQPTGGRIEVRGSIAGLMRVGENLDDELTAHEIIRKEARYLNVDEDNEEAFRDEVLEFAGLRDFEDVQVRRYSTGMALRLGLSMILVARPDTVVMGDILGVGDLDFRQRTWERVKRMSEEGTTFLLIGPGYTADDTADRRFLIERGKVTGDTTVKASEEYIPEGPSTHTWHQGETFVDNIVMAVQSVNARAPTERRRRTEIRIRMAAKVESLNVRVVLDLFHEQTLVMRSVMPQVIAIEHPCAFLVTVTIPPVLAAIPYRVRLAVHGEHEGRTRTLMLNPALSAIPTKPAHAADMDTVPVIQPAWAWTIRPFELAPPADPEGGQRRRRRGAGRRRADDEGTTSAGGETPVTGTGDNSAAADGPSSTKEAETKGDGTEADGGGTSGDARAARRSARMEAPAGSAGATGRTRRRGRNRAANKQSEETAH